MIDLPGQHAPAALRGKRVGARTVYAVGLMTGTVLDGNIDVALLQTDGIRVQAFGEYDLAPYDKQTCSLLQQAVHAARRWQFDGEDPAIFAEAEAALTRAQASAVLALLDRACLQPNRIGVVGFHGQSVLHRAPDRATGAAGNTRQLGDGALMARLLGIPVAFDFRSADVRAGGQGAPLSPVYHRALLRELAHNEQHADPGDTAVLNLGGVGNLSWWDGGDRIIGFDTGPANAPLNDWVRLHGLGEMDRDGALAASGSVDEQRLATLLQHPWLDASWPKSLDRFDFAADMASGLGIADGAALLTAFSAAAVGRALDLLPQRPRRLIVCGGGRRNPAMMQSLALRAGVTVSPAESVGWRGDAVEAECFAYLAVRTLRELPISFPGTTGAPAPTCGGRIARPDRAVRPG